MITNRKWGLAKSETPNRGGVLGAMGTGYQRSKIQETIELARSTDDEKVSQLSRLGEFHTHHAAEAPAMLKRLQQAVIDNANVFEVLMDAVRVCSLGQITGALFEVGGSIDEACEADTAG
jgi:methylmalonyl-CoA mutase